MDNVFDGGAFMQPESAVNPDQQAKFPFVQMIETESGHTFEMDDTPGRERVRLHHRTGTFIEMNPDGSVVVRANGTSTEVVVDDKEVKINGNSTVTIMGNAFVAVHGDKYEHVYGDYNLSVDGDFNCTVNKQAQILSDGDMRVAAGNYLGGKLSLTAADSVFFTGDILVEGEIVGFKITSKTRVDAGIGVSAGPEGFVSGTGGLTVGYPGLPAIPGCVNASLFITAGVKVAAPLGSFGTMTSFLMTDVVNTSIFDAHIHIGRHGPTTPPIISMVTI